MTSEFWKGAASPRVVSEANIITAANRIGCEPETLKAVWEVEASGQCFDINGGVVKRFEPHLMPRENWERMGFVPRRNQPAWRASSALSETVRWQMFEIACRINPENAARATSWGGSQILGRWFAELGYSSAVEMVQGFADSAANQLDGFVTLVESWGLVSALRARDWHRFATRWNGSGQPAVYAGRLETAYRRLTGEPSAVVLHPGASSPTDFPANMDLQYVHNFTGEDVVMLVTYSTAEGLKMFIGDAVTPAAVNAAATDYDTGLAIGEWKAGYYYRGHMAFIGFLNKDLSLRKWDGDRAAMMEASAAWYAGS